MTSKSSELLNTVDLTVLFSKGAQAKKTRYFNFLGTMAVFCDREKPAFMAAKQGRPSPQQWQ